MEFSQHLGLLIETTKYSDCITINCWYAPTAYDILEFINSQKPENVNKELVIDFIKRILH